MAKRTLPRDLDPGVAPYVRLLDEHGVHTYESCQGKMSNGPEDPPLKHCRWFPWVHFYGTVHEGLRVYAISKELGLPVLEVALVYSDCDGMLEGPAWCISFRQDARDWLETRP